LGEFSPIWQMSLWAAFLKTAVVAKKFGLLFSRGKSLCVFNLAKMVWASLWAVYSQAHLVTLLPVQRKVHVCDLMLIENMNLQM
jgi:hypothetical protein